MQDSGGPSIESGRRPLDFWGCGLIYDAVRVEHATGGGTLFTRDVVYMYTCVGKNLTKNLMCVKYQLYGTRIRLLLSK